MWTTPANNTTPAFTRSSPGGATTEWTVTAPADEAYYSLIDPVRMKGWVGWPTADVWHTKWSSVQLAVRRRTGKVRRSKTSVLPLCYIRRQLMPVKTDWWLYCSQVENGSDPLKMLAESCKRICPTSVKPLQSTGSSTSENDTISTMTMTTSTSMTTSGSEIARCLEPHETPTTIDVEADCSTSDDGGKNGPV